MPSIFTKLSAAVTGVFTAFKRSLTASITTIHSPTLISLLNELMSNTLNLSDATADLDWYQAGHPLHVRKGAAVIKRSRTVEETLYVLDRTHNGGVQDLLDKFYTTSGPILVSDAYGTQKLDCRPAMDAVFTELGMVYSQLTFEAKWSASEVPITSMIVKRVVTEEWNGGWILIDSPNVNPMVKWVVTGRRG